VVFKKKDKKQQVKEPETKQPEKSPERPTPKKDDADKFDLIKIVSSEDKEIPEQAPPFEDILDEYIPESEQRFQASKDDHNSGRQDSSEEN